jgi:uncharacterized protein (TIGR00369 family)
MKIKVETQVNAPIAEVWRAYTSPEDIVKWNAASEDWHTTKASVDLREGGEFSSRMEAKDGSMGFDFAGTYTKIIAKQLIEYAFGDRKATIDFEQNGSGALVRVSFDAESTHSTEQQTQGWQSILNNFKRHVETGQERARAIAAMTGLELMQAVVEGKLPRPPMGITIPMEFRHASHGNFQVVAKADARHTNPMGGVHGGFAATVLDSVTGCAVHTALEAGVSYGTVDLNVKMLKPVPQNVELLAEGKVLHISRTLGVAEGSLRDPKGVLLAHATATCVLIRQKD